MLKSSILAAAFGLAATGLAHDTALESIDPAEFTLEHARHLLMRAGFGGTVEEVQRLHRLGLNGMVDWLVDYEKRPDTIGPPILRGSKQPSFRDIRRMSEDERRRVRQKYRREDQQRFQAIRRYWIDRMMAGTRPLEEKMTLFWHGHFTTSYRDVRSARLIYQQNELLRRNATGNFGVLLHEISKDPAMLGYLNNNQNRKGRPNENYAREVMELFTLGIGNYTEKDIKEVARAFTGWTADRRRGRFINNTRQHDFGKKTIFGKSGNFDGDGACDLLLAHPACAPHVAGKIFSWFAYANPEPALVAELAAVLRDYHWELKPLLRRIFKSRAFYSAKARGSQVKSPVTLLVSTVRMLGIEPPPADVILGAAGRLGQNVMMPPNVKGWEGGFAWITTASLLDRNNMCGTLLRSPAPVGRRRAAARNMNPRQRRRQRGQRALLAWDSGLRAASLAAVMEPTTAADVVDGFAKRLLFVPLTAQTRQELIDFLDGKDGSRAIDVTKIEGPAVESKLRELIHLIMSTPEFQVC